MVVVLIVAGLGGYFAYQYLTAASAASCATTTPAPGTSSGHTITVGMPIPTESIIGKNYCDAAQMAVNQINAAGGVKINGTTYSLKIVVYNTAEDEPSIPIANGISAVTSLITTSHANFLIGGYRSDVVLAELPIVAEYKELYITFGADTAISSFVAQNYSKGGEYIFNGFLNPTDQTEQYGILPIYLLLAYEERAITGFTTNITKIAVLGEDAAWTSADIGAGCDPCTSAAQIAACPLAGAFDGAGFQTTYCEKFPLNPSGGNYRSLLTTLANDGTQAIYMLAAGTETPLLISNYGSFNWGGDSGTGGAKPLLLGADVMAEFNGPSASNNNFKMTNGAAAGEMTFGWGPTLPLNLTPTSLSFYNQFEANYSLNPGFEDGFVYSSFFYLAQAIEKANSLSPSLVAPYLEQTDFTGPMGVVQFSPSHGLLVTFPNGNPSVPAFGMQWHTNGKLYPLWSSLWCEPSFIGAETLTITGQPGGSVSFENYETPSGTLVGNFTVAV